MKKHIFKGVLPWMALVLFTACSKNNSSYGNTGTTSSNGNTVSIYNMSFVAATTTVSAGTTVTWTNNDPMVHTVTADDNSFSSANLNSGDTYTHTFNTAGTVAYHCKVHPGMTATVVVK